MTTPRLKACPFCGEKPKIIKDQWGFIECHGAGHRVIVHARTEEEAIKAWNRRSGR